LERCEILDEGWIIVPVRDDRDLGGTAPNRQLALPATDVVSRAGESLSATSITETADTANHRFLERGGVAPASARQMPRRRLERLAKSEAGVANRNLYHFATKSLRPAVRLHGDPAALAGVLENVLTDLRQRHREADDRFG